VALLMIALSAPWGARAQDHSWPASSELSTSIRGHQNCQYCHAAPARDGTPDLPPGGGEGPSGRHLRPYRSPTLDARVGVPSGISHTCLSCHDGSLAPGPLGSHGGGLSMSARAAIGADGLQNDHPVSFTYDDSLAQHDGELHFPSRTPSGMGGTIAADLLDDDRLECTSCHQIHSSGGARTSNHLLIFPNSGSRLCLTCHDK